MYTFDIFKIETHNAIMSVENVYVCTVDETVISSIFFFNFPEYLFDG